MACCFPKPVCDLAQLRLNLRHKLLRLPIIFLIVFIQPCSVPFLSPAVVGCSRHTLEVSLFEDVESLQASCEGTVFGNPRFEAGPLTIYLGKHSPNSDSQAVHVASFLSFRLSFISDGTFSPLPVTLLLHFLPLRLSPYSTLLDLLDTSVAATP